MLQKFGPEFLFCVVVYVEYRSNAVSYCLCRSKRDKFVPLIKRISFFCLMTHKFFIVQNISSKTVFFHEKLNC